MTLTDTNMHKACIPGKDYTIYTTLFCILTSWLISDIVCAIMEGLLHPAGNTYIAARCYYHFDF